MTIRSLARLLPGMFVGVAVLVAGQVAYVVRRDLPSFEGHDASTRIGDPGLPRLRVTAFGDSTLTGPGLSGPDAIWIRRALAALGDRYHIELDSRAVGGSRAGDALGQSDELDWTDIAVVAVGSNDAFHGTPLRQVERHLRATVEALLPRASVVVLCGVGDLGTIPRLPEPLARLAARRGHAIERIHTRVAAEHERVLKVPVRQATVFFRTNPDAFVGDLFHANERGHSVWATTFLPTLEEAISIVMAQRGEASV